MIFETLTVADFGVFKGLQQFDLAPRVKYGSRRPIILFGGLNGSGKTSVLTAIRIALHGRQALGFGTSQRKYESLLLRLFHKDAISHDASQEMSVKLDFSYSSLGAATRYTVERIWRICGKALTERFALLADGKPIESSDPEQAQAFLTQLVPVGVADLFFFDGEKIAELASEDSGEMLAEAIRRLLGLDIVNKLKTDLDVYERRQGKRHLQSDCNASEFDAIFEEIEKIKSEVDFRHFKIRQEIEPAISNVRIELDKLEGRLSERGGAWAVSRDAFRSKLDDLLARKVVLETRLRDLATGLLPLALAPTTTAEVVKQLELERDSGQSTEMEQLLHKHRSVLGERLRAVGVSIATDIVLGAIQSVFQAPPKFTAIHKLGESDRERLITGFSTTLSAIKESSKTLKSELDSLDDELAFISNRIAAAPSEEQLKEDFELVKRANQSLGELLGQKRFLLEEVKTLIWRQIELVRRLKKDYSKTQDRDSSATVSKHVAAIRGTLDTFSDRLVERKTAMLADQFITSFHHLTRKRLLVVSAVVDPKTLHLKLIDGRGHEIQKSQLSAGERQLFAIAMLDALAKTSGRSIPIIIDTPLGRLDSRHRKNLVKHYLPHASHQVVVLSTDTEVDEHFFEDLGSTISHAYHLDFDESSRATVVRKGYFWRKKDERKQNAA